MTVKEVVKIIEDFAPPAWQESYDNVGLQVGDVNATVTGMLLTLDVTVAVVEEAIRNKCNMIVAHHPVIFSGLKKITGRNYVERIIQKAIKYDISIYAAHTNLDNMLHGVNARIAQKLQLRNTRILAPKEATLAKLYTYAPYDAADKVREALFAAGAGEIGKYSECSYNTNGKGTFRPAGDADPAIGRPGGGRELVDEVKIEVILQTNQEKAVLRALFESHPYEEVAYELVALKNDNQYLGAGMVGTLPQPMEEIAFLAFVKEQMKADVIRHTQLLDKQIYKVAVCGGSGSFLLKDAIAAGADVFITADFKYHQFFDAEGKIVIADIGHYESEQFTVEIFEEVFREKIRNFAILLSKEQTNPIKYFY
jgi:dinuclear metal center YbgI/SA1388 family protein